MGRRNTNLQGSLPGIEFDHTTSFGGSLLKNSHAKKARPLSSKQALHIVLRSDWARGERSLLKNERVIQNTILKIGRKNGVRVYRVSNAGNHLHLLVRFTKRRALQNFLRSSCGLIARKMLGAERGSPHQDSFWSQRPFTRIVSWGRDFNSVLAYVKLNTLEALGFLDRRFTKAMPTQEIRNRILNEMSLALGGTG
ncbi:MAG: transposase [Bdellovibrionota bacterium]